MKVENYTEDILIINYLPIFSRILASTEAGTDLRRDRRA